MSRAISKDYKHSLSQEQIQADSLQFGPFNVIISEASAYFRHKKIDFTAMEYNHFLTLFIAALENHPAVKNITLIEKTEKPVNANTQNSLKVCMNKIRGKIAAVGGIDYIQSVRGSRCYELSTYELGKTPFKETTLSYHYKRGFRPL
tara:strand:- start:1400 stop:1840 length:441 start_codon:yes stop_codon:yes gene_type:complete